MAKIRTRLALGFSVALGSLVFVFGLGIYLSQRADSVDQLDARAQTEADRVAAILTEAWESAGEIVIPDPVERGPTLSSGVASQLRALPDFVVIVARNGVVHISDAVRELPFAQVERLSTTALSAPAGETNGYIDLAGAVGRLRYYFKPIREAGPNLRGVLVATSARSVGVGPARLLTTMALMAPLIFGASILLGHYLVGRTFRPVMNIVDEVEAITDGRSLHRRLAEPLPFDSDEVSRLTSTLNAMFARLEINFANLRRFTSDASHELKTPLTILRAGVEQAITHPAANPEVLQILEETLIEVNRMTDLVESLLVLASVDEGRAPLLLEEDDLREFMTEIAETASLLGEQERVAVEVTVPEESFTFMVDRSRFRQLAMNLLSNAVKYTPAGGRVYVECEVDGQRLVFRVRDTGIGIAPGDLPHIFDRFWRVDPARSSTGRRPGTGLGLAICKWIAEAHGGSITARSRPGRGSTFTVTVPLESSNEAKAKSTTVP